MLNKSIPAFSIIRQGILTRTHKDNDMVHSEKSSTGKPLISLPKDGDNIPKMLIKQAGRLGDVVALREKRFGVWRNISWNQYMENVRACFFGLKALGVSRGDRVSLISENRPEWLYLDLAIQSAGAITAAINVTNAPDQVA